MNCITNDPAHLIELANILDGADETILGPSDSASAASALRFKAAILATTMTSVTCSPAAAIELAEALEKSDDNMLGLTDSQAVSFALRHRAAFLAASPLEAA